MGMTEDKFRVSIKRNDWSLWMPSSGTREPDYFDKFWEHCERVAEENGWLAITVANYELRPLGGRLIQTKTYGWYLRWDTEAAHTMFVLKWT